MSQDTDRIRPVGRGGAVEVRIRALCLAGLEQIRRWYTTHSGDDYDISISIPFGALHIPCLKSVLKSQDTFGQPDDSFRRIRSRRVLWSSLPISATDPMLSFSVSSSLPSIIHVLTISLISLTASSFCLASPSRLM